MFHSTNVGLQMSTVQVSSKYFTKNALQVTSEKILRKTGKPITIYKLP